MTLDVGTFRIGTYSPLILSLFSNNKKTLKYDCLN